MTLDRSVIEEAAKVLDAADDVALACHVGPDGDALGSMLGLAIAASNRGKEVVASFAQPYVVPPSLSFLPDEFLVSPDRFPRAPDLMVVLDAGSLDRLGDLAANASDATTTLVFDHHVTNSGFGDVSVVDPTAAATGELVYEVLGELGWEITPEIAMCLLTSLMTDTGRFQYSNTTAQTHRIAASLMEAGARPDVIARHVYEEAPFGYLKAAAVALGRAELDGTLGVVSTSLTDDDLKTCGIGWDDVENLIDLVRLAVEADTAILAKGHTDGRVMVSMRSRGDTDVGSLAAALGGGGHRLAAGFTTEGEPGAVIDRVRKLVGDYR